MSDDTIATQPAPKPSTLISSKVTSDSLTPREIVSELDKHIIGQEEAKRAVAIALRNRWRRRQVDEKLRTEITPKNILMIGPTGVGKTEIARRLAKLVNAPFIKVEATKFTEVGYVGRDVESIIRDLVDMSIKMTRENALKEVQRAAEDVAEERILDTLMAAHAENDQEDTPTDKFDLVARQRLRKQLREGDLDQQTIEIDVASLSLGVEIMGPPGMEEMTQQLQSMLQNLGGERKKRRRIKVKEALKALREDEANKMVNDDDIKSIALERVEQNGIVFLDELDKVTQRSDHGSSAEVSREGVQRDLLPLVEGCTISTRYGMVKSDHILFIASGAFHVAKPSDLMPELQGRFPIRVELNALTDQDFIRILTEPRASLTKQYTALLATEEVQLEFTTEAIAYLAKAAWNVNERTENIGARRLHTVMERLLESLSFDASDRSDKGIVIDQNYVSKQLQTLIKDEDLSRYIL